VTIGSDEKGEVTFSGEKPLAFGVELHPPRAPPQLELGF